MGVEDVALTPPRASVGWSESVALYHKCRTSLCVKILDALKAGWIYGGFRFV